MNWMKICTANMFVLKLVLFFVHQKDRQRETPLVWVKIKKLAYF